MLTVKNETYEMYKRFGAHLGQMGGQEGVLFSVWAPNAAAVSVVGDFNDWDPKANPMMRETDGVYSVFVPKVQEGSLYKYCIETKKGELRWKADPFAFAAQLRPGTSSKVADLRHLRWTDEEWMAARKSWKHKERPVSVYEVHIGSWKRQEVQEEILEEGQKTEQGFYNYRQFAKEAAEYVKEMGYTHIELMGIAEHPLDGSWGYQVTGYYAPTSRYGTPEDFAYMIDYFHRQNIGVILDWVPAHFPKDEHGLAGFDGTALYEYADSRKGDHAEWGTKVFDYGKAEVKNFLIANALYWIEQFHVDGLRVDAVASMLYLDYGRQYQEWIPNSRGDNENLEAAEFLRELNAAVKERNDGVLMIAEESTAWPKVTGAISEGGLGFDMKWNMGWMHDFTEYMKTEPYMRKKAHHHMTFGMMYAYNEDYMLVLSHDEVVHLKGSMLGKMPGPMGEKYANLKAAYAFMVGHVGKKLLFMGQDFGQKREWSEARALDWQLLSEKPHRAVWNFVKDLLHLYQTNEALYECDCEPEGFAWINADDEDRSIYSFMRHSKDKRKNLLFVCSFTAIGRKDYRIGVPEKTDYTLILNSDAKKYGGEGKEGSMTYQAEEVECDGQAYSFAYDLPPYGAVVFEF